jgi:hypothetical protein
MAGWAFNATCPYCGGELAHIASGTATRWETRAVAACTQCGTEMVITVTLAVYVDQRLHGQRQRAPCGTEGGYKAHLYRRERTCSGCREAHRVYVAERTPPGARHAKAAVA